MNHRNMFAIWPLIVRGRNRRGKQENIKGPSDVCVSRGGVPMLHGATAKSVSGGSVNIIQTNVCVCDLQH